MSNLPNGNENRMIRKQDDNWNQKCLRKQTVSKERLEKLRGGQIEYEQKDDDNSTQRQPVQPAQKHTPKKSKQHSDSYERGFLKLPRKKNDKKRQDQLIHKKARLQEQLQKIKIELKQIQQKKKHSWQRHSRVKTSLSVQKQEEYYKRADSLIRRIREQREQRVLGRKRRGDESKGKEQMNGERADVCDEEVMREQRRREILRRIEQRNHYALVRKEANKRSNSLIKQLIESRPHCLSTDTVLQKHQLHTPLIGKKQSISTSQSQVPFSSVVKKYRPGRFLLQVFRQQEQRKSQQKLKVIQRRRVILKHKEYSEKIRSRTRATSTYLTQVDRR